MKSNRCAQFVLLLSDC